MSDADIVAVLKRNGFSAAAWPVAYAIVMAESGGDPQATHTNADGSIDRGLWQINSTHVTSGAITASACFDPDQSTKYAYQLSHGGTAWGAWSTFGSGAYKKFVPANLQQVQQAFNDFSQSNPITAAVSDALKYILGPIFSSAGDFVVNAGMIVLGLTLVGGGVILTVIAVRQRVPQQLANRTGRAAGAVKAAKLLAAA